MSVVVGFLHPGMMGRSLAAACSGTRMWASVGRSAATRARAESALLTDAGSVHELCARVDVIVAICPPSSAVDVAQVVAGSDFSGTYVDANAIAPVTARSIGAMFDDFVDGSVIGPPADEAGTTRLYLAGANAASVAALWEDSLVDARIVVDDAGVVGDIGDASALKMAYASWTKISASLQLAVRALAAEAGVEDALVAEWEISQGNLAERSERAAIGVAPKAWRFVGEMEQIAQAFADAGLPDGFGHAASAIYTELAGAKGHTPSAADVIAMLAPGNSPGSL